MQTELFFVYLFDCKEFERQNNNCNPNLKLYNWILMEASFDSEKLRFPIGKFTIPELISESDTQQWISEIESFSNRIYNLTRSLSVEQLNWNYRPNGWTIKQVIHHCADSHMNSFIRFKLALTEEIPTIKPYEESKWAELIDGVDNDISASLKIIEGVHYRWTLLLKSFSNDDFSRQFIHPESKKIFRLDEATGLYAWHCNHHLAHIHQAINHKGQF